MSLRSISLAVLATAVLLVPALPAAAETIESDFVLIRPGDTIGEDVYAVANRAEVAGRVEGDLVIAAAGEVRISGTVTGDLTVFAGSVIVSGTVGGSLRGVARSVEIAGGTVAEDVFVAAWDVAGTGEVGRDLYSWAMRTEVGGTVGRNVDGQQRELVLTGAVAGDVDVAARRVEVGSTAEVAGDLRYVSRADAVIAEGSSIEGQVIHRRPLPPNVRLRALWLLGMTLGWIAASGAGLALLWAVPGTTATAARRLRARPLAGLIAGLAVFALPWGLVAGAGVILAASPPEAAVPLVGAFLPVILAVFGLMLFALLVAPVPVAIALGGRQGSKRSHHARLIVGMLALGVLVFIPVVGIYLLGLALAAGLGGWLLLQPDGEAE